MKINKSIVLPLTLLVLSAALYRVWPGRPFGFAPQWAMAVFAGAVIKDKRLAFILPLISMIISDALYQVLFVQGSTSIQGFYAGQLVNYVLLGSLVVFGFMIRKINTVKILSASLAAPSVFFLLSNLFVWIGGGGYSHPKTVVGLMQTYADGVPFYQMSLLSTVVFSGVLFGVYFLVKQGLFLQKHQLS
ncbi:MAG: DUF6580 family putative transport protein [Candidatus Dadabacteria bacterium]